MNNNLTIKLVFDEEKRIFDLNINDEIYSSLLNKINEIFKIKPEQFEANAQYKISFKDESGDFILISSNQELENAYRYGAEKNPLILYIQIQKTKRRGNKMSPEQRMVIRYSKPRIYQKMNITDENEIEIYKSKLIELHNLGFKRSNFNIRVLVDKRNGDDFSLAFEEIKNVEGERNRKRLRKKEKRQAKIFKKKKGFKRNNSEEENSNDDNPRSQESGSESGSIESISENNNDNNQISFVVLDSWPVNIQRLYIDGNNLLYLTKSLRDNTLRHKRSKSQEIIVGAVEAFASCTNGLIETIVIFDKTNTTYEKNLENGTRLVISSARPQEESSDDALVHIIEKQNQDSRNNSLIVTSDRGLSERLKSLGSMVVKPKNFFNILIKSISNEDNVDFDQWFIDLEKRLDESNNKQ